MFTLLLTAFNYFDLHFIYVMTYLIAPVTRERRVRLPLKTEVHKATRPPSVIKCHMYEQCKCH